MKQGKVYIKDVFCGIVTESEEGYCFEYDKEYLSMEGATALSRNAYQAAHVKALWARKEARE